MSEQKPIVSIYVETSIKLDNGDFFVVNKITEKDGKYLVELQQTEPEEHVDDDYLYEWSRDNYEPDPEDFHHDLD
jgi:hypothetical protein